jgi:hypothetical protein
MVALTQQANALLRGDTRRAVAHAPPGTLCMMLVLCGAFYGAVMGGYGGFGTDRWLQVLISASKVPLLLLTTFGLALPSFYCSASYLVKRIATSRV